MIVASMHGRLGFDAVTSEAKSSHPVWALRAHDVEEFIDVVRRYGAWDRTLQEFVAAAGGKDS